MWRFGRRNIYPWKGVGIEQGGLKAELIACVLNARLSSMYAPVIPLAFVCIALACKVPQGKS
jgi:hypothetical protein